MHWIKRFQSVGSLSQPESGVYINLGICDLWHKTWSQEKDKPSSWSLGVIGYEKSKVEQCRAKPIFNQKKKKGKLGGFWRVGWVADRYAQGWRAAGSGALLPKAE